MPFSLLLPLCLSGQCPREEVFQKHQRGAFTPHPAVGPFLPGKWSWEESVTIRSVCCLSEFPETGGAADGNKCPRGIITRALTPVV